jgi:hypothetical protein
MSWTNFVACLPRRCDARKQQQHAQDAFSKASPGAGWAALFSNETIPNSASSFCTNLGRQQRDPSTVPSVLLMTSMESESRVGK